MKKGVLASIRTNPWYIGALIVWLIAAGLYVTGGGAGVTGEALFYPVFGVIGSIMLVCIVVGLMKSKEVTSLLKAILLALVIVFVSGWAILFVAFSIIIVWGLGTLVIDLVRSILSQ